MKKIFFLTAIFFTINAYSQVVTISGYLHVYPEDLGEFSFVPAAVIAEINKRVTFGYNDWRVPTQEEFELIKSNSNELSGLTEANYLTTKTRAGKLRLVRTGMPVATRNTSDTKNTDDEGVIINGVKWATRNVDKPGTFAKNSEDPGMFYQWNSNIGWSSSDPRVSTNGNSWKSPWNGNNAKTWEKSKNVCPAGWRIPTQAEFASLDSASSVWTDVPVKGRIFGSENNSIFLPSADCRYSQIGHLINMDKNCGYYWSSTTDGNFSYLLHFTRDKVYPDNSSYNRGYGFNVRCVAEF